MNELTISEARDRFSSLIADLDAGRESEYVVKNRNVPVAKITAFHRENDVTKRVGLFKDEPLLADDDWFDEADSEIAELFGVEK